MKSTVKLVITEANGECGRVGDIQMGELAPKLLGALPLYRITEGSLCGFMVNPQNKDQGLSVVGVDGNVYYRLERVKKNSKTLRKRLVRAFVVVGRQLFEQTYFTRNGFASVNDWARMWAGRCLDDDGDFRLDMMLEDFEDTPLEQLNGADLQDFVRDELHLI